MANFTRHSKRGDYQPVPNSPCLNMVTAIIDDYKRSPKRLQTIILDKSHWRMINDELKKLLGSDYEMRDVIELEGCDVGIQFGGSLQAVPIRYEFVKDPFKVKAEC
jgi:hypothetical protein